MSREDFTDMQIAFREMYPEWAVNPFGYEFRRAHEDGLIDDTEYADAIKHYRVIAMNEEFHRFLTQSQTVLFEES